MYREGSTFSDTRNKSIHTNATLRRIGDRLAHFPHPPCFILPPEMSLQSALAKADKARIATRLVHHTPGKLHPSEIENLDNLDFAILQFGQRGSKRHVFTPFDELSQGKKDKIEEERTTYRFSWTDLNKVDAADRILERHKRVDAERKQLEVLGFGVNRLCATLTAAENRRLHDMADESWVQVRPENLFANEADALKSATRTMRKAEASSRRLRFDRDFESVAHGTRRANWRSEVALNL
ncbi:hypothetical protein HDU98_001484 [Podochytrium sp. JEL0797]|nr:hypothetical protein HDU98_001484 [Podochytrium sp. JEL0797]